MPKEVERRGVKRWQVVVLCLSIGVLMGLLGSDALRKAFDVRQLTLTTPVLDAVTCNGRGAQCVIVEMEKGIPCVMWVDHASLTMKTICDLRGLTRKQSGDSPKREPKEEQIRT